MLDRDLFVDWFRNSAPYINAHRGRCFVIQFGGEAVGDARFAGLVHDIALLDSIGVRLVLVHGARPQIEERLRARGHAVRYVNGIRVTDAATLEAVKDAVGAVRVEVEAQLSTGLANSPMAGAGIDVASGNFVIARPMGVRDGVDYQHTGEVRRVDAEAVTRLLDDGAVVLVSPLGYSPTGEVFGLPAVEVAAALAVELRAAKLVFLSESEGIADEAGGLIGQLTLAEANRLETRLREAGGPAGDETRPERYLALAGHACRHGVSRCHIVDRRVEGALLLELFTRDGIGTMIAADAYDATRRAAIADVGGILELIAPLEADGVLVRRSREKIELEIERYLVVERDGTIIACAAVYPFPGDGVVELACLAVREEYRRGHRGDALLEAVEREARALGAARVFVLTTRATHWFKERGFVDADLEALPVERRQLYNWQRNSKVLIKTLE